MHTQQWTSGVGAGGLDRHAFRHRERASGKHSTVSMGQGQSCNMMQPGSSVQSSLLSQSQAKQKCPFCLAGKQPFNFHKLNLRQCCKLTACLPPCTAPPAISTMKLLALDSMLSAVPMRVNRRSNGLQKAIKAEGFSRSACLSLSHAGRATKGGCEGSSGHVVDAEMDSAGMQLVKPVANPIGVMTLHLLKLERNTLRHGPCLPIVTVALPAPSPADAMVGSHVMDMKLAGT